MEHCEEVLRVLCDPRTHGVNDGEVSWIETHMSWIVFTPGEVLKFKKPVRTRYLDHSTLAQRERDCREEVRLNARLAPGVYLGLTALQRTPEGLRLVREEAAAKEPQHTVEWLVRMRRLPEAVRLDHCIARQQLDTAQIDAVADRRRASIAAFRPCR